MLKTTPFHSDAVQSTVKQAQENILAWGELAQHQLAATQTAMSQAFAEMQNAKDAQAAMQALKTSTETAMELFSTHMSQMFTLGVMQFHNTVDAMEESHPLPHLFAPMAKGMREAANAAASHAGSSKNAPL